MKAHAFYFPHYFSIKRWHEQPLDKNQIQSLYSAVAESCHLLTIQIRKVNFDAGVDWGTI